MSIFGTRFGVTRYEADEHYRIALDYYNKKNMEEAINNMTYAIELFPKRAEYYATRGFFHMEDGIVAKAAADFDMALRLHPYDVLANYGKGVIAYNKGDFQAAREYFTKSWAANQQRPETLYYLALTEHRLKNNLKAIEWMRLAANIYGKAPEDDKEQQKRKRNAKRWLEEFVKQVEKQRQNPHEQSAD
jgi:tetratricopeptide (TPR) repeat protein